jgi:hypothetical protein
MCCDIDPDKISALCRCDGSAHQLSGLMYLLDLWRGQTSSDIWIEAWCDMVQRWKPALWAEEQGQIISGVGPFLRRRAIERHAYTTHEQFASRGDKAVRAQSMRGPAGDRNRHD